MLVVVVLARVLPITLLLALALACAPQEPTQPDPVHLPPHSDASSQSPAADDDPPNREPVEAARFSESCPTLEATWPVRAHSKLDEDPSWLRQDPTAAQKRVTERLTRFLTSCKNATVTSDPEHQSIVVTLPEPCGPHRAVGRAELHFLPSILKGFLALNLDIGMNGTRYSGELVLDAAREANTLCLAGRIVIPDGNGADIAEKWIPPPPGGAKRLADATELQRDIVWPLFPWLIFPTKYERGR